MIQYVVMILVFALIQALLLNNMLLFGVVSPLLFVYFVLTLPRHFEPWVKMVMAFVLGLLVDMFSNTPGLSCASMTLAAMIQPFVLELYMTNEDEQHYAPSVARMGFWKYLTYALMIVTVFCFTYYTLDAFTFFEWQRWLGGIGGSILLTTTMIITIDSVRR